MTQHRNAKTSDGGKLSIARSQCDHHAASVASVGAHPSSQPKWYSTPLSSPPSPPRPLHVSSSSVFGWGSEACFATNAQAFSMGLRCWYWSRVKYSGTWARNQFFLSILQCALDRCLVKRSSVRQETNLALPPAQWIQESRRRAVQ